MYISLTNFKKTPNVDAQFITVMALRRYYCPHRLHGVDDDGGSGDDDDDVFVVPSVGLGHPSFPPLSIYFLIFSPFYFSLSFIRFTYFYFCPSLPFLPE